jgi:hypothetical protein
VDEQLTGGVTLLALENHKRDTIRQQRQQKVQIRDQEHVEQLSVASHASTHRQLVSLGRIINEYLEKLFTLASYPSQNDHRADRHHHERYE